jgi:hypothetical protein
MTLRTPTVRSLLSRVSWFGSILCCVCLCWILSLAIAPAAQALTQIRLFDVGYQDCPEELAAGAVTSGGNARPAHCFLIVGKAENTSGKPVVNADIFGRIFDANGDSIMQNRGRLGSVEEIPPGISEFQMRISVPANQPEPLALKQFKAAGFTGKVRR